jgi:hypothetical protein
MDRFSCDECREIYQELRKAAETADWQQINQDRTAQRLVAYLEQLDEADCARMRENSPLWKAWRRLVQHRTMTGHTLSVLPITPDALSNPN